ncbi:hypothetical protein ANRL3_02237 [Anaerolineae bacterium]|nr:hypothetical protein ANRL3_02237 [Anaerolineae bacterium]
MCEKMSFNCCSMAALIANGLSLACCFRRACLVVRDVRMIDHPLIRGLRRVVFFDDLGAVPVFFVKF